jgi:hypothetical protein
MYMASVVTCVCVTSSYKIQKLRSMEEEYLALLEKYNATAYNKYKKVLDA